MVFSRQIDGLAVDATSMLAGFVVTRLPFSNCGVTSPCGPPDTCPAAVLMAMTMKVPMWLDINLRGICYLANCRIKSVADKEGKRATTEPHTRHHGKHVNMLPFALGVFERASRSS
jgi:hypothetical protein